MEKILKNRRKLVTSIIIGILIATILSAMTIALDKYSISFNTYYFILFLIGPLLLVGLMANSSFVYYPTLYIYFICLSIFLWRSKRKSRILILAAVLLIHLFSTLFFLHEIKSSFKFLDEIDWSKAFTVEQK